MAVSFTDRATGKAMADAVAGGADVLELRVDRFASTAPDHVLEVARRARAHAPVLATIRTSVEGGEWEGDESERLDLFRALAAEVDGVDVELSSAILPEVVSLARHHDRVVVVSFHDFDGTPSSSVLDGIVADAHAAGADIAKVAVTATTHDELRVLAGLVLRHHERGVAVLGMGDQGPASRIVLPLLGSRLTFAATESLSVPGQLPLAETVATLDLLLP